MLDGRYTLIEQLGAGGMGVVYKAEHRYTGELVAIKLLPIDVRGAGSTDEIRQRFLDEPRLQLLARHPNVLRVIDAGVAGVQPYLVTEYVDGENLEQRIARRGVLPVGETLAILHQASAALDAAHRRGIIHRDVKPANMLIRADGHVLLTDFGVAKDATRAGATAMFVGTTHYAAPEQITLQGAIDERADVYGLGCVMFHCLTGRPPYRGGSPYELMNAHIVEPPPHLGEVQPGLPDALDAVIARALAKDRESRQPSCGDLVSEAAAATGTDLTVAAVSPRSEPTDALASAVAGTAGAPSRTPTYAYLTEPIEGSAVAPADQTTGGDPTEPRVAVGSPSTPPAMGRPRRRATGLAGLAIAGLLGGALVAYSISRLDGGAAPTTVTSTRAGLAASTPLDSTNPATGSSGFTGYAARLASDFPGRISSRNCRVAPDGDSFGSLVQIRCSADSRRVDTYYELWPSRAAMNRLLDANSGGLNVYFAGTWTDASGVRQGRIDQFITGLLDPHNVILWSYDVLNATVWAQSTLDRDELLAWWRTAAPRAV